MVSQARSPGMHCRVQGCKEAYSRALTPSLSWLHQEAVAQGEGIFGERVEEPGMSLDSIDC